jgi:hypothetical protein
MHSRWLWVGMVLAWFVGAPSLRAQSGAPIDVYPVRVNHKMGFVKFYPSEGAIYIDTIIPPRYDYIADEYLYEHTQTPPARMSPYRLFELDSRVGLLDQYLQELLPNEYTQIRPLSRTYFALERDSVFRLHHLEKGIVLDSLPFENIYAADRDSSGVPCFFVKLQQRWGLYREDGLELIPARYQAIKLAGADGFYQVIERNPRSGWQLIDQSGRLVFSEPSDEILALREDLVARDRDGEWTIWKLHNGRWTKKLSALQSVVRLNGRLAVYHSKSDQQIVLWDYENERVLRQDNAVPRDETSTPKEQATRNRYPYPFFPWYYPLDETCSILCEGSNTLEYSLRLIDSTGRAQQQGAYTAIAPSNMPGLYLVKRLGSWGLAATPPSGELLACENDNILPFVNDVAIFEYRDSYGLISWRNGRSHRTPAAFVRAEHHGEQVWAEMGQQLLVFELNEQDSLAETALFDSLLWISTAKARIREAPVEALQPYNPYRPRHAEFDPLRLDVRGGAFYLVRSRLRGFGYREEAARPVAFRNRPSAFQEILEDQFLYLHEAVTSIRHPELVKALTEKALRLEFFDLQADQYVPGPDIIGMYPFDEAYPYTPFLRADGSMGLINRKGQELQQNGAPLRLPYIGPFEGGRARACRDATWLYVPAGAEAPLPQKFHVATPAGLREELGMRLVRPYGISEKEGQLFLVSAAGKQIHWGYLSSEGEWVLDVEADYIENFHWEDSTAIVYRQTDDMAGCKASLAGLIDYQGKELLPVAYPGLSRQEQHLLLSVRGTPTFFFSQKGHQVFVNPTRLRPFSGGLAQFRNEEGHWGYVNEQGEVVIPPQYRKSRPFSDGLALVADAQGRCLYIHSDGRRAFVTNFEEHQWRGLGDFHEGRCWMKGEAWRWGLYDQQGQMLRSPDVQLNLTGLQLPGEDEAYPLPIDFRHGLAPCQLPGPSGKPLTVVLDTLGKVRWEAPDLQAISAFDEQGLAVYTPLSGSLKGLIDREGNRLCGPAFRQLRPFREQLAAAQGENQLWGFVRRDGSWAIPPRYAQVQDVSEGLVAVQARLREGWSFIDTSGQLRIQGPFQDATPFELGVSLVRTPQGARLIDAQGVDVELPRGEPAFFSEGILGIRRPRHNEPEAGFYANIRGDNIFGRQFSEIHPFQQGVAKVRPLRTWGAGVSPLGAINTRGVLVVPPKYRALHVQPDGNIVINPQQYFGLADKQGRILLPPEYDRIQAMRNNPSILRVERGEHIGYLWMNKGRAVVLWELQN